MRLPLSNVGYSSEFVLLVKVWKIYNETGDNCKMRIKRNVLYYVVLGIFYTDENMSMEAGSFFIYLVYETSEYKTVACEKV